MNKIIFIFISIFGFSVSACPNLIGSFVCSNSADEKIPVKITRSLENGISVYTFDYNYQNMKPFTAVADGIFESLITKDFRGSQRYSCKDNTLIYERVGEHSNDGSDYAHSELDIVYYIDADNNLQSNTHLNLKNYNQENATDLNFKETCIRTDQIRTNLIF